MKLLVALACLAFLAPMALSAAQPSASLADPAGEASDGPEFRVVIVDWNTAREGDVLRHGRVTPEGLCDTGIWGYHVTDDKAPEDGFGHAIGIGPVFHNDGTCDEVILLKSKVPKTNRAPSPREAFGGASAATPAEPSHVVHVSAPTSSAPGPVSTPMASGGAVRVQSDSWKQKSREAFTGAAATNSQPEWDSSMDSYLVFAYNNKEAALVAQSVDCGYDPSHGWWNQWCNSGTAGSETSVTLGSSSSDCRYDPTDPNHVRIECTYHQAILRGHAGGNSECSTDLTGWAPVRYRVCY